jgi:hypothetical protein
VTTDEKGQEVAEQNDDAMQEHKDLPNSDEVTIYTNLCGFDGCLIT